MIRNKRLVPDAVLDDEGRQRFHGAFTGGFSAGHYNTVGSEEGFKPTAFVSSRSNRASHKEQSANDFVDSEDGLLGGILSTNSEQVTVTLEASECVVKIPQAKANYFGIGYDPAVENPEVSAYRNAANQVGLGKGVYRMDALIPAASTGSKNSSDLLRNRGVAGFSLNDDEDDVYDNINHIEIPERNGYLSQVGNKFESDSDNEQQSFGNKAMVKAKDLTASVDKWLGSSIGGDKLCQRCPTDGREVLSGFVLSTLKLIKPIVIFAPPPAPRGFTALHVFPEEEDTNHAGSSNDSTLTATTSHQGYRRRIATANGSILENITATAGVIPGAHSVSIPELIQAAMKNMANRNLEKCNLHTTTIEEGYKEKSPKTFAEAVPARPMLTSDALLKSTFAGLSKAFQGRFVSSTSSNSNESNVLIAGLTTAAEHAEITAAAASAFAAASLPASTSTITASATLNSNQQSSESVGLLSHHNRNIPEESSPSNGNLIPEIPKISKILSLSNYKSDTLSSVTVKYNVKAEVSKAAIAIDSASLKGKASRVSRAWYPVPLLSRRFHIKMDGENNGTKGGRQQQQLQQQMQQHESRTVDSQLDSMFAGLRDPVSVSSSADIMPVMSFASSKILPSEREHEEFIFPKEVKIEELPLLEKPPMSLFKSIFENGDSSDSSDDDDDDDVDDEKEDEKEEKEGVKELAQEKDRLMEDKRKNLNVRTILEIAKEEEIRSSASVLVSKSILLGKTLKGENNSVSAGSLSALATSNIDELGFTSKEKERSFSSTKTANNGSNHHENNNSKKSNSSKSMEMSSSKNGNSDDSLIASNQKREKEKEIDSEDKAQERVVFRKPVAKAKLNTFSNKLKNRRVVNIRTFEDEEEKDIEEIEETNGPKLIPKIQLKMAKVKNEAVISSNISDEKLIIVEEKIQMTSDDFTEPVTASSAHQVEEAEEGVEHKKELIDVLGCTNLKAISMIETDETRTVTEWYARNEMKKKEREEIVRKLKYEEEMEVEEVFYEKSLTADKNDRVEQERNKKERKRKHSHRSEEKEREKEKKNDKKSHKTLKSKKSKKSKKRSRDHSQSEKKQQGSGNDTNSSESESD